LETHFTTKNIIYLNLVYTAEMEPGLRVTGQRVTGSAIWVRLGSGLGSGSISDTQRSILL